MTENSNLFWDVIEAKMGEVPNYLKNILKLRGYENAVSIQTIEEADIESFHNFLKSDDMKSRVTLNAIKEDYYGVFWETPATAYILPGHVKFLEQIVAFVNITLVTKGYDYFNSKTKVIQQGRNKIKFETFVY